ncbi:MAG: hypothetical protein IJQ83_03735 [Bacteroidales bacterium]|nr:hypothetical protein [Bacteroidales bacterium]
MKKWKKVMLIILAVLTILVAAAFYFLPVRLLIHTFANNDGEMIEVRFADTIPFVINGDQMLFKAEVNGKPDTLMYDSGVNSLMLMMYTPSTQPEGMKFYRHRVTGADKKSKVKATTLPVMIGTSRVNNSGIGFALLNPEPPLCEKKSISDHHLLGSESLNIGHYKLDFSKREITFIPYSEPVDTAGFVPIKCAMKRNALWVYPQINGVEYECIFDTGNGNAGFLLKDGKRVESPKENDLVYEGSYGNAIGGRTNKQRFVRAQRETFSITGVEKETEITYVKDLPFNNMGLKAISQFDWIISAKNNGPIVYVRPHAADEDKPSVMIRYKLIVDDGKLKISARLVDGKEVFKVGDQIISVNGEKITEENICHYYDLMTESKDWSGLEIRVK